MRLPVRIRLEDPVLRILAVSTLFSTLGRGVFLTLTTLYLGFAVRLPATQIALVFGVSSVVAILASLLGGHLSDRISARRLVVVAMVVNGLSLGAYALVDSLGPALVVAAVNGAALSIGQSARSSILGRGFAPEAGVHARAVLRTLTNIGIGAGSAVAAVPLAIGTAAAYRLSFVIGAVVITASQLNLVRLPPQVDSPLARGLDPDAGDGSVAAAGAGSGDPAETPAETPAAARRRRRRLLRAHSPWRDPRYLALSLLSGILAVQFTIQEVGMPLWVARDTSAPPALVSVLLVLNTLVVIAFTVRLSRGTHDLRRAARVTLVAGGLLALTCGAYAAAHGIPLMAACLVLVVASLLGAFAEVLSQAGSWGLSFELADPLTVGSYQGVFGTSHALGSAVGPALIAATALAWGWPGWGLLAVLFGAAAVVTAAIALRAARDRAAGGVAAA